MDILEDETGKIDINIILQIMGKNSIFFAMIKISLHQNFLISKIVLSKWEGVVTYASIAQWQSTGLVNQGS